ncbi:carboxypeptidase-like regulatory domain-containing protein [Coleofasciculus sp. H7-2]|uniref:carboxypeptidase-like regulatory domain-containing protein n=1 Tax=Coleofasciculus sp. H7-2 TaxID=3351545 RepID=UPI00366A9F19
MKLVHILPATLMMVGTLAIAAPPLMPCGAPNTRPVSVTSGGTRTSSGIEGQVLIGPVCPVQRIGDDCADRPFQASITVLNQRGQIVTRIKTDGQGKFQIKLKPGKYTIRPESPGVLPRAAEQTITVTGRKFAPIQITYDSGIR